MSRGIMTYPFGRPGGGIYLDTTSRSFDAAASFLPGRPGLRRPPRKSTPRRSPPGPGVRPGRAGSGRGKGGNGMRPIRRLWTYPVIGLILVVVAGLTAYAAVRLAGRWLWARLRGRSFSFRAAWRQLDETSAVGGPAND